MNVKTQKKIIVVLLLYRSILLYMKPGTWCIASLGFEISV